MSTCKELTNEISACERQIVAVKLKTEEKLQAIHDREGAVGEKRKEWVAAHEQQVEELTREHETRKRAIVENAEKEIAVEVAGKLAAQERAYLAEARAEEAERRAQELQKEIKAVQVEMDRRVRKTDQRAVQAKKDADEQVLQVRQDTDRLVHDTALYAAETQEGGIETVLRDQDEAFQARCNLHKVYYEEWAQESFKTGTLNGTRPALCMHPPEMPDPPLKPESPERPRSSQLARQKALAQKALELKALADAEGGEFGAFLKQAVTAIEVTVVGAPPATSPK